ncbi:putative methylesterase 19 [Quercus suber]|uniref:Methylesterase 19 n=1 Tax=Quercus suber TaxID=58331 RepID=A0AAW0L5J3_QUESU
MISLVICSSFGGWIRSWTHNSHSIKGPTTHQTHCCLGPISCQPSYTSSPHLRWMIENNPTNEGNVITGSDHMGMFSKPKELSFGGWIRSWTHNSHSIKGPTTHQTHCCLGPISCQPSYTSSPHLRWMIENNPTNEGNVITGSDHMGMFSKPKELCSCLQEIADKYS